MADRVTDQERLLRQVPERAWTTQVVNLARLNGWRVHHSRPALMRSGRWATALQGAPGLPDLVMVRPPRLIFAELKRQARGVITALQQAWLEDLRGVPGIEVYTWRPGDVDHVYAMLRRDST